MTEASKQNFNNKFISANLGASNLTQFSKNLQRYGNNLETNFFTNNQKDFLGLQDYMYMDKTHAMQSKSIQKSNSGFSIDEIMKR